MHERSYLMIPGAGGQGWYWHLVRPRLEAQGHAVATPDLPAADPAAGLPEYLDVVADAARGLDGPVVVAQSMGGLLAPLVAERLGASAIVLVAAMIPAPGETGGEWWATSGQRDAARACAVAEGRDPDTFDPVAIFFHDVPAGVLAGAPAPPEQSDAPFALPNPMTAWPDVPTRVVAGRHDRLFPLAFMQALSRRRLGIEPEVVDTGHLPALAAPDELARLLLA